METNTSKDLVQDRETKSEKFVRIVSKRLANAIEAIEMIGKTYNKNYEFTQEQTEKISDTLKTSIGDINLKAEKILFPDEFPDEENTNENNPFNL